MPAPREPTPEELRPPEALNLTLAALILGAAVGLQILASRTASGWGLAACAIAFAFLLLPLYTLLHDAEHRVLLRRAGPNDALGVLLASFFPGPFTFLRACHLGHHRRNRSEAERFDLVYPDESVLAQRAYFYFLYLGGFWLAVPLATLVLIVHPRLLDSQLVRDAPSAAAMIRGIPTAFLRRIRLEALGVVALHAGLILGLGLDWRRYLLLYAAYGLCWSSQQYVTHAASPRSVLDGAHNLRAHPLYESLLLHFNWHLAHHQQPRVPWLFLPRFDDTTRVRPGYLTAFIRFWRGPQPAERPSSEQADVDAPPIA